MAIISARYRPSPDAPFQVSLLIEQLEAGVDVVIMNHDPQTFGALDVLDHAVLDDDSDCVGHHVSSLLGYRRRRRESQPVLGDDGLLFCFVPGTIGDVLLVLNTA